MKKKRTLKLMSAIARGAWLVSDDWVYKSIEAQKWIFPEDEFELVSDFPGCRTSRLSSERLLKGVKIALCGKTKAPTKDLVTIITNSGAILVDSVEDCNICISENGNYAAARDLSILNLPVAWLFDSVTAHKKMEYAPYLAKSKSAPADEEEDLDDVDDADLDDEVIEEEEEETTVVKKKDEKKTSSSSKMKKGKQSSSNNNNNNGDGDDTSAGMDTDVSNANGAAVVDDETPIVAEKKKRLVKKSKDTPRKEEEDETSSMIVEEGEQPKQQSEEDDPFGSMPEIL